PLGGSRSPLEQRRREFRVPRGVERGEQADLIPRLGARRGVTDQGVGWLLGHRGHQWPAGPYLALRGLLPASGIGRFSPAYKDSVVWHHPCQDGPDDTRYSREEGRRRWQRRSRKSRSSSTRRWVTSGEL